MVDDPYLVLGVAGNAPQSEIRTAYLRAMRNSHADLGGEAGHAASRFNAAYALIGTPGRRASYNASFLRAAEIVDLAPGNHHEAPSVHPDEVDTHPVLKKIHNGGFAMIAMGLVVACVEFAALVGGWFIDDRIGAWGVFLIFATTVVSVVSFIGAVSGVEKLRYLLVALAATWTGLAVLYYPQILASPQSFPGLWLLMVLATPVAVTAGSLVMVAATIVQRSLDTRISDLAWPYEPR